MRTLWSPFTAGVSDRVWKLPFTTQAATVFVPGQHSIQICLGTVEVMTASAEFLAKYNRPLMERLSAALEQRCGRLTPESTITRWALETAHERAAQERAAAIPSAEPIPSAITAPKIPREHWAYKRHQNVGNGISYNMSDAQREAAEHAEAASDIGGILGRIGGYSKLSKNYSGQLLYESVSGYSQFKDTYATCMTLCAIDLSLPAHFMALIHYGIGLCCLTQVSPALQQDSEWVSPLIRGVLGPMIDRKKPEEKIVRDRAVYETTHEAFDFFVAAYLQDFGSCSKEYAPATQAPVHDPHHCELSPLSMPSMREPFSMPSLREPS